MNFMMKFPLLKLLKTHFGIPLRKLISTEHHSRNNLRVEQLKERGILRIHGSQASIFLQGLITNDMKHLEEGSPSMYCMFLNIRGRVLCDSLLYKESENTFLIESDKDSLSMLQKHLTMYRVRKKIDIHLDSDYNIWVMFRESGINNLKDAALYSSPKEEKENIYPAIGSAEFKRIQDKSLIFCRDPRLSELGFRIIAPAEENFTYLLQEKDVSNSESYKMLRYKLGVGEGVTEIPPGKSFPLELNCDFLHGVSFHKGCYIGQELTARVYHTGVIRKRLMPLILDSIPSENYKMDAVIENGLTKTSVGKLRGLEKTFGLGLLKIDEAIRSPALDVLNVTGSTFKPNWWPQEAPKERSMAGRE